MIKELSVTEYCKKYKISRHAVHRRIKKIEESDEKISVNNITEVKRLGPKIIVLVIDSSIKFKKRV